MIYQGYKVLIATFLNRFVALGALYSSGLFLVHLEHTFQVSRSIASLFPSIYGCMALLSALVAGYIQDLLINRDLPISLLFVLGGMMLGGGMIGSSYADSIELALFSACFTGAGFGIVGFSASGILAQWFEKWRGTALLIGMSGNGAGSFAYAVGLQAMFNYFSDQQALNENANDSDNKINAVYGDEWRYALRMCGSMSMLVVISVALFLRVPYLGEVEECPELKDEAPYTWLFEDESVGSAYQRIAEVVYNDIKTQLIEKDKMQIERREVLHCVRGEHLASRRYMAEDLERSHKKMLTSCTESTNEKITQLRRDESRVFHDVSKFPQ